MIPRSILTTVTLPTLLVPKATNVSIYNHMRGRHSNNFEPFYSFINGRKVILWTDTDRNYYYNPNTDELFVLDIYSRLNTHGEVGPAYCAQHTQDHTFWALLCDTEHKGKYGGIWASKYNRDHAHEHNFSLLTNADDIWFHSAPYTMPNLHGDVEPSRDRRNIMYLLFPQSLFSETDLVAMRLRGDI